MESQKKKNDTRLDRLTTLPDALIHHIFSFMDLTEIIHTRILSNRWKSLWVSLPNLDFNLDDWLRKQEETRSWLKSRKLFMSFIDKVLFLRRKSNIFKFSLISGETDLNILNVFNSLMDVLACDVQHIVLRLDSSGDLGRSHLKLPNNPCTSTIRVLELDYCPHALVQWLDIFSNTRLQKLQLRGVTLPNGNDSGELIISSDLLKDLSIDDCNANHLKLIRISTPLLEKLQVCLATDRTISHRLKVKMHAVNLKSVSLLSSWTRTMNPVEIDIEGDLISLVTAFISISKEIHLAEKYYLYLMKFLPKVCNAQDLKLGISSKKVLTDFPTSLEGIPCRFHNLRYMKLKDIVHVPFGAILRFLERFPNMETLVWSVKLKMTVDPIVAEELETNLPLDCMFTSLKTVEIVNLRGVEDELKFLAFILEKAPILREVIIKCKPALSNDKVAYFQEKFSSFSRASSNISLTLLQKPRYYS